MPTAFVLTGGATHGAVQAGMLVALLEAGWQPDLLVGSSVGALNGAFLACDPTREGSLRLSRLWMGLRRRDLFPVRPHVLVKGALGRQQHFVEPSGLAALIAEQLPVDRIEATAARLLVMATDAVDASPVVLSAGPIREALLASCAIPGLLPPVSIGDRKLVDGAIGASAPIDIALAHGADRVVVLPTTLVPRKLPRTAMGMAVRGVDLLVQRSNAVAHETNGHHDVLVVPAPEVTESPYTFRHSRRLLAIGYDVAHEWLQTQSPPPSKPR